MKNLLKKIGFSPKENKDGVFTKKYSSYAIEVDLKKKIFNYGGKIIFNDSKKTIQNITKPEDWVVFECVNRLLDKGYKPEDIILEKRYKVGHGQSGGRLDILVKKEEKAFLMIECKTWGKEFEKEFNNLQKKGGQVFTYFQQDRDTEYLMLYTSSLNEEKIEYENQIIKIEEDYREAGNTEDVFDRWSKVTYQNGIFEDWILAYDFQNKALTKKDLKPLSEEDSHKLFHEFLAILRKHSISDKSNAFNKIFNLFLAKIFDEQKRDNDELEFQWREGKDDAVDFQIRLINLYKSGMDEFLKKEIEGISDDDFNYKSLEDLREKKRKWLKFNKIFDIKDVFDDESFEDNQKVLKEIVELLHQYQVRYPRKQKHLSDFFELLLTTGLKQESGQFFTPPPVARFIVRSLPIKEKVISFLNQEVPKLPAVIDYAAGSGHFITETMEEIQSVLDGEINTENFFEKAQIKLKTWRDDKYDWAKNYMYGIEKDDRLVKVAKVGCYFYGDGLAQVIEGDGLDSFRYSKRYRGLLEKNADKPQFDFVVSNPPYSVKSFKRNTKNTNFENEFELYKSLTDQSSEIEALFVERTVQLLKEGGIAAIILPSSILSNSGIYTQTREIILKYFEIIAITELGSNTFMATGTNTVVLFLRRRNNKTWQNVASSVEKFLANPKDVTVNGIEKIFSKYVNYVWENLTFADYKTLCEKNPNEAVQNHEIFVEYSKKLKVKNEKELIEKILEKEKDKLLYFVLAYRQKIVLVKSGEKKEEKNFLGYEFSFRRGSEGIHPIQRGKSIDDCTQLFDAKNQENPKKASSYIYKAFNGDFNSEIDETLKNNVSRIDLVDTLTFDRVDFEKTISLSVKKKIKIESRWELVKLGDVCKTSSGGTPRSGQYDYYENGNILWVNSGEVRNGIIFDTEKKITEKGLSESSAKIFPKNTVLVAMYGATTGQVGILGIEASTNQAVCGILPNKNINHNFLYYYLRTQLENFIELSYGVARSNISQEVIKNFQIPLPPKEIQEKIVKEVEILEKEGSETKNKIEKMEEEIEALFKEALYKSSITYRLSDNDVFDISIGKRVLKSEILPEGDLPIYSANVFEPFGYINKTFLNDFEKASVLWGIDGDWMVNYMPTNKPFYPTDHCGVLRVKDNQINEKYLAYVLKKEGEYLQFSRTKRASIDRIQGIKIQAPPLPEQQKIVAQIEKIETQIADLKNKLSQIPKQKEAILKKYL